MTISYDDIVVANDHAHLFRRKRFASADIFAGEPPLILFGDHAYELKDISGSGAAGLSGRAELKEPDTEINHVGVLRLVQSGEELFKGVARLVRAAPAGAKIVLGFSLEGDSFDLDRLRKQNAAALARNLEPSSLEGVSAEYKAFCADAVSFVSGYLNLIDRSFGPVESGMNLAESNDIARHLCRNAAAGWRDIVRQGNDLVIPLHGTKRRRLALKEYTERVLTPVLLDGEGWTRTYTKPLGYPGDFQIMNYIYDGDPIGSSIRSKFLHLLSLVGAEPVKTRMLRLSELIVERTRLMPGDGPASLLSVGAGPTREAEEILRLSPRDQSWNFHLVDQEDAALEYSLAHIGDMRGVAPAKAIAHHASFKDMLDPTPLADTARNCSVIYSAGLVDYLNPLAAMRFVKRSYELLRPGASIIIGNVNDKASGMLWPSEYVVDWTLFFRSREQMVEMARGVDGAEVAIETDSLDAIYFLLVRKPL